MSLAIFIAAYWFYGGWLSKRVFALRPEARVPSREKEDGCDYVPTHPWVVFGHHFTSIAGTGPIVGPAIAVVWGWLPALAWIVLGAVFIGAVHDLGALVVSLRNNGQTVGEIAARLIHPRARLLFLLVLVLALTIVLAIFGMVIASVFRQFPSAIFPCLVQIPLAMAVGILFHRRGARMGAPSAAALAIMYVSVIYGDAGPLHAFNQALAAWPTLVWVAVLLAYCYAASVLPVWLLLQPRDFINALQLLSVLGLLALGLVVAGAAGGAPGPSGERPPLEMAAPAVVWSPAGAPPMFPFLFITVACGAVSGFHCLVSSGTSSKQLRCETDARMVGYGAMLTEGFLAVMVTLACAAALGLGVLAADGKWLEGQAAWQARYPGWVAGFPQVVANFVDGAANLLQAIGIERGVAGALMGVFVASFAATTLDTACRLQRYVVQELAGAVAPAVGSFRPIAMVLQGRHGATAFAVLTAGVLAAAPPPGKEWSLATAGSGGTLLWPLFGATNQLLGGLAFLVVAFYLLRQRAPLAFLTLPMVFMLVMPMWAMLAQTFYGSPSNPSWISQGNWLLAGMAIATCLLEVWMVVEAARAWVQWHGAGKISS